MKLPMFISALIVLGIVATNAIMAPSKNLASDGMITDTIETSQAAAKHVDGDMPL